MKKVLFGLMIVASFAACNEAAKTEETPKVDSPAVTATTDTTVATTTTTDTTVATTTSATTTDTTKK